MGMCLCHVWAQEPPKATRFVQLLMGWWCLLKPSYISYMQRSCYANRCFGMVSHKRQQHAATQHAFPELQPFMHRISAEFARSFWHEQTSRLISNRSFRVPVTSSEHLRTLKAAPVQVGTSTLLSHMYRARNIAVDGDESRRVSENSWVFKSESYTNEKLKRGKHHDYKDKFGPVSCWRDLRKLDSNLRSPDGSLSNNLHRTIAQNLLAHWFSTISLPPE